MTIRKINGYKIVCPHCGAEITITNDEYMKYRKETEDYGGSTVLCQREKDGESHDIEYTNMDCPSCKGYIPVTVANGIESDTWGFVYSKNVTPIYGSCENIKIEDYISDFLGADADEDEDAI